MTSPATAEGRDAGNTAPGREEAGRSLPGPERPLRFRGWAILALCVLGSNAPLLFRLLRGEAPVTVTGPHFRDDYDRTAIGPNYFTTGGHWRILRGELWAPHTLNNPLWLKMRLPQEVAIEFDARSETSTGDRSGDIKFEVFGNGRDHASGYVCIFGGWGNQISAIARLDEHGSDRKERRDLRVEAGRTYHMRLERSGRELSWSVDGRPFLAFYDPHPLAGKGHDRFGFSSWDADVFFDHLRIEPLREGPATTPPPSSPGPGGTTSSASR